MDFITNPIVNWYNGLSVTGQFTLWSVVKIAFAIGVLHAIAAYAVLAERKISLELTEAAKELLFTQGYDPNFGARPLKRAIQKFIQDQLALKILDGEVLHGDHVIVDADKKAGKMKFEVSKRVGEKEPAKTKR